MDEVILQPLKPMNDLKLVILPCSGIKLYLGLSVEIAHINHATWLD